MEGIREAGGLGDFLKREITPSHQRAAIGQKLELAFNLKKCHFFDGVTEKTIV